MLRRHGRLDEAYGRAINGNVALCGEIAATVDCVIAIGFGRTWSEAGWRAGASLQRPFREVRDEYVAG